MVIRSLLHARDAMGTRFEVVLPPAPGVEDRHLLACAELVLDEIEAWDRDFSLFRRDSFLGHLNRTAATESVRVTPEIGDLFALCRDVGRESGGAFDIAHREGRPVQAACWELDESAGSVRFVDATTRLDLGGVAKGFALDRAAEILDEHGIGNALVHGGTSSVLARGVAAPGSPWRIGVRDPRGSESDVLASVELHDLALGVSGPHLQRDGARCHLRDPRGGERVTDERLAVVVSGSAALADAWSTAFAVSPPEMWESLWARSTGLVAGLFLAADGAVVRAGREELFTGVEEVVEVRTWDRWTVGSS